MKAALTFIAVTSLLASCAGLEVARLAPAPADECQVVSDFMAEAREEPGDAWAKKRGRRQDIVLNPVASSAKELEPSKWWSKDPPSAQTYADLKAKRANVRLDLCPALARRLHSYGWRFWDGHTPSAWHWQLTRVGFNAAHTEAIFFVEDGWGEHTGDAGFWSFSRKDPATGRWRFAAGGSGWIS